MSIETEVQKLIDQTNKTTADAVLKAAMKQVEDIAVALLTIQKVMKYDPPDFAIACALVYRQLIKETCPQAHKQFYIDLATKIIAGTL